MSKLYFRVNSDTMDKLSRSKGVNEDIVREALFMATSGEKFTTREIHWFDSHILVVTCNETEDSIIRCFCSSASITEDEFLSVAAARVTEKE